MDKDTDSKNKSEKPSMTVQRKYKYTSTSVNPKKLNDNIIEVPKHVNNVTCAIKKSHLLADNRNHSTD